MRWGGQNIARVRDLSEHTRSSRMAGAQTFRSKACAFGGEPSLLALGANEAVCAVTDDVQASRHPTSAAWERSRQELETTIPKEDRLANRTSTIKDLEGVRCLTSDE